MSGRFTFRHRKLPVHVRPRYCVRAKAAESDALYAASPPTATSAPIPEPGQKLGEWLKSPFDLAAFGPRVTVGALMSVPERLSALESEVQRVTDVLQSPAPIDDKTKMLASELETCASSLSIAQTVVFAQASRCGDIHTAQPPAWEDTMPFLPLRPALSTIVRSCGRAGVPLLLSGMVPYSQISQIHTAPAAFEQVFGCILALLHFCASLYGFLSFCC